MKLCNNNRFISLLYRILGKKDRKITKTNRFYFLSSVHRLFNNSEKARDRNETEMEKFYACLLSLHWISRWEEACMAFIRKRRGTLFLPADAGDSAQSEVRRQFSGEKQIALTFDDGPSFRLYQPAAGWTQRAGVHATFFLLGENIDGKEGVIRQMKEDGHLIGNHGFTHVQMSKETLENACGQIGETNRKIEEITGQRPEYLRPPVRIVE